MYTLAAAAPNPQPSFGSQLANVLAQGGVDVGEAFARKGAKNALNQMFNPQEQSNQPPAPDGQNAPAKPFEITGANAPQVLDQFSKAYGPEQGKVLFQTAVDQQKQKQDYEFKQGLQNTKRQNTIVEGVQKDLASKREALQKQRHDFKLARQAVNTGKVGGFDINYIANALPGEIGNPLKNASGAQLESAMKGVLISDLGAVSGQKNQFLEKTLKSSLPSIGKTKEANDAVITMFEARMDVEEKLLDAKQDLIAEYEKRGQTPPSNIDKIAQEMTKDYAIQREDRESYDIQRIFEKEGGERNLRSLEKVAQGTMLTKERRDSLIKLYRGDKAKAKEKAISLGYTIPTFDPSIPIGQAENEQ